MKRLYSPALLVLALAMALTSSGCKTNGVAPPLAPGYNNQADQQMGSVLAGARAFYTKIQADSASGATTLSQTEKDAFNKFGISINLAEQIYLGYHAGTQTLAAAQSAVNSVSQQQAALPIPSGKTYLKTPYLPNPFAPDGKMAWVDDDYHGVVALTSDYKPTGATR